MWFIQGFAKQEIKFWTVEFDIVGLIGCKHRWAMGRSTVL